MKIDFGQVVAGTKKTQPVTLTNTGTTPLTLPQASVAGASYSFTGLTLPMTLQPGQMVSFNVLFQPAATGAASGTMIVASDDSNIPAPALVLSGMGLSASGPTITAQPTNQSVVAGQTATFSVTAAGTEPITYQWKKNGSTITGATGASYTTPATSSSDSGAQFSVVVTDSVGTVTSSNATLTVTTSALPPSITSQPANASVVAGQTATFSVVATGTTPLSYQWRKNGANISGAIGASYTTPATTSADSGSQFSVVVTNAAGTVTSNSANLTVNTPISITSQPVSQSVVAGQTAAFSVTATGSFSIGYQWRKNGVNISGATGSSYTTPATVTADNGAQFSVVVTSSSGTATSNNATLTVTASPVAPSISTQPANKTVTAGQVASFSVTASGTAPLTYQWRKNGTMIAGATSASYSTPATTSADSGAQFTVIITNSVGSVTSSAAILTVNDPPSITAQPASVTVVAGQTATFSVSATGTAPLSYQWKKNGANVTGATATSYTTPATATSDSGAQFTVTVSNVAGAVTSNVASLTVTAAPVAPTITTQPANRTVVSGQTASFSVTAAGTAPLGYQWQKNSANIAGATSASYTTPPTTTADNGAQFSVVITNSIGSVTSNAATLTVNAATFLLSANVSTLNFANVNTGSSKQMSASISNSGNSNISVSAVSLSGPGFSVSGISSGTTLTPGQSANLNVTFAPASVGSASGSVSVSSNATNSPVTITLSGTGLQAVQHSSALSWTASTSAVAGYYAYRGIVSGGPYTKLNSSMTTLNTYTDSTVLSGLTYYYVVTAVDSNGDESIDSNQVTATIP